MIDKYYFWSWASDDDSDLSGSIRRMNRLFFQNRFTDKAQSALQKAYGAASQLGSGYVGSEHLLLGLCCEQDSIAQKILAEFDITDTQIASVLSELHSNPEASSGSMLELTPKVKRIIEYASMAAVKLGHGYIGTEHLLMGIIRDGENIGAHILSDLGVDLPRLYARLSGKTYGMSGSGGGGFGYTPDDMFGYGASADRSRGFDTKTLNQYSRDLTAYAREGKLDPVIGRDREINQMIQILSRRGKNNPALIGEPGVGKTAVAEGLAQKIAAGDVPSDLAGKRLVSLDLSGMIAGTKYRGEFEERIKNSIDEVAQAGNIILFIDEMHTIIGAGAAEGSIDASNILKPALSRGELQVVGATTVDEYRRHIEKDAALERRFQPVMVNEPSMEDTEKILYGLRDRYEAHHGVKISDRAISAAVKLSARYIGDRYLPDKAIDVIDQAASVLRMKNLTAPSDLKQLESKMERISKEKEEAVCGQDFEKAAALRDKEREISEQFEKEKIKWHEKSCGSYSDQVSEKEVSEVVSEWTGIPVSRLTQSESEKLLSIESTLHERIVGQQSAVSAVARAVRRGRAGIKDPNRPVGSFIFLGPTGVGKTELSKALAEAVFGDEKALIRVDMSEFMEKHTVSKLIGSPPGYVGYDDGGQLTEKIRRKPYSVILFDEIEKAHPDVFNALLQILEDGILTDAHGRRVSFKNCIIIMTSNIGARFLTGDMRSVGFSTSDSEREDFEKQKKNVLNELKRAFKPEFINRVDEIIVFNRLNDNEIGQIADKMLLKVKLRMAEIGLDLTWDKNTISYLSKKGFDEIYGARPLRRAIQSEIEDAVAERLLDGRIKPGAEVKISAGEDGLTFE